MNAIRFAAEIAERDLVADKSYQRNKARKRAVMRGFIRALKSLDDKGFRFGRWTTNGYGASRFPLVLNSWDRCGWSIDGRHGKISVWIGQSSDAYPEGMSRYDYVIDGDERTGFVFHIEHGQYPARRRWAASADSAARHLLEALRVDEWLVLPGKLVP